MDYTDIIVAIITGATAVVGSALVQSKQIAVLQTKIEALEKRLEALIAEQRKYNNLQERVLKLEVKNEKEKQD